MKHRDIEYAVIQDSNRGTCRWTVELDEKTAEAGQRKTRDAALTAVELTIDRWLARQPGLGTNLNLRCEAIGRLLKAKE